MKNKYGSTASVAVWEKAEKVRQFKYEQQMKASKTQSYAFLGFAALLIGTILFNIAKGIFS